jgi:hypothetical protein
MIVLTNAWFTVESSEGALVKWITNRIQATRLRQIRQRAGIPEETIDRWLIAGKPTLESPIRDSAVARLSDDPRSVLLR